MDWHDSENPVQLGKSIAEQIMAAPEGATIPVTGRNALGSAITYAKMKRPNDNLIIELVPLPNSNRPLG